MNFNVKEATNQCIDWIRKQFDENGKDCNAIVGISGGVDSSVVAALCVEALGKDRVIGVLMPNGEQNDIDDALDVVDFLQIKYQIVNIAPMYNSAIETIKNSSVRMNLDGTFYNYEVSEQTKINLAPRLRMSILYAVSQSNNGRVMNTCNLSEDYVGYSTRYGDSVGDFSPLANFTKTEVIKIAEYKNLPEHLAHKTPTDGVCGKNDEENLGFAYEVLDNYIRIKEIKDLKVKKIIDELHEKNKFKLQLMPTFKYEEIISATDFEQKFLRLYDSNGDIEIDLIEEIEECSLLVDHQRETPDRWNTLVSNYYQIENRYFRIDWYEGNTEQQESCYEGVYEVVPFGEEVVPIWKEK